MPENNAKLHQYLMRGTTVVVSIDDTDFDFDLQYDVALDRLRIIPTAELLNADD